MDQFVYNNLVKLSDFVDQSQIQKNADFYGCGKLDSRLPNKLVAVTNKKYIADLIKNIDGISAVICTKELADLLPENLGCAISDNPISMLYSIHETLTDRADHYWQSFPSKISKKAKIHPSASIAENNVIIGDDSFIGANAFVGERVIIGKYCIIGANSSIGTDAYEIYNKNGQQCLAPQAGGVKLGDGVVCLSNVTISKSAFPVFSIIGNNCSFDNLVQVGHDAKLGNGVKMATGALLCGRCTIEDNVYIGPGATISNGISIHANAKISIGSVVVDDVKEGTTVTGNFAIEHLKFLKKYLKEQ